MVQKTVIETKIVSCLKYYRETTSVSRTFLD